MIPSVRSLNVAISAAIVLSEALRQLKYSSVVMGDFDKHKTD